MRSGAVTILLLSWAGCSADSVPLPQDLAIADLTGTVADSGPNVKTCDVLTQTCAAGKCSITDTSTDPMNPAFKAICVPETGANTDGQPCTRTSLGHDDCKPGLICTIAGQPTGSLACVGLCHGDTDCKNGSLCASLDGSLADSGFCLKACTLFGSNCPVGMTCADIRFDIASTNQNPQLLTICRSTGTTPLNGDCMSDTDCPASSLCDFQALVCVALCDADHLCPGDDGGGSCQDQGLANSGGICNALP